MQRRADRSETGRQFAVPPYGQFLMKLGLFRRTPEQDSIHALYGAIVAHARSPAFYRDYRVPDTVPGRLEMILIHAFLFSRRTRAGTDELHRVGQAVFDRFCDDMDANLREMGVGDLAVPKHMRRIGEAFYGRATAYDAALAETGDLALTQALIKNVLNGKPEQAQRLAAYMRAADEQLAQKSEADMTQGKIDFPDPGKF